MMQRLCLTLCLFLLVLIGCRDGAKELDGMGDDTPTAVSAATPDPTEAPATVVAVMETTVAETAVGTTGVFISELLPGVPGGNSREFIELYNAGTTPVDLNGWSLVYLLNTGQAEQLVYRWTEATEIPGWGHYLLVRDGQTFDVVADASFDISLFERKGGVLLRDAAGEMVDVVGWGDAPDGFFAKVAANAPTDGNSLERLPGGVLGNGKNSENNEADWTAVSPNPQNSGNDPTPRPDRYVRVEVMVPEIVVPGETFPYDVVVTNMGDVAVTDVTVSLPLAEHLTVVTLPAGSEVRNGRWQWQLAGMAANGVAEAQLLVQSPFTYVDIPVQGYYAESAETMRVYGALQMITMSGGAIPIAAARELVGEVVSVEGVATMYTGGFFAGSGGVKFYVEDESGGIQVYVPDGNGVVEVAVGDRVRVTGGIEVYRNAIELVPVEVTTDVEILAVAAAAITPAPITAAANETDDAVLGRLNVIEGTATRIEEFAFSYEVDLLDEAGNTTLIYIEKDTGITAEPLAVDKEYRIMGISEYYDGERQVKPRVQDDIVELFPPILLVEQRAQNSVQVGEPLTYEITAYNHTPDRLTNVLITAVPPMDGVVAEAEAFRWRVDSLPGDGASAVFSYTVAVVAPAGAQVMASAVTAVADEWQTPAMSQPFLTFIGDSVPIWAIQGPGMVSPYAGTVATTKGVVVGIFPELAGFWIQEVETDEDPTTSAGIFVLLSPDSEWFVAERPLRITDEVRVTGRVREISGQTTLFPDADFAVERLSEASKLPEPTRYDPPVDLAEALVYNESLEGMWVTVGESEAVVVAPTTRFGEYVMVLERWGVDRVRRLDEVGYLIYVDDGSAMAHQDQSTLPYVVQRGDRIGALTGVLAYTFGNYKIEPVGVPLVTRAERPLPTLPPLAEDQFSVATFNVENFFDLNDPHPASPPRPTLEAYRGKIEKIAQAIERMGAPAIIGLQEVENLGLLARVAEEELLAPYQYEAYLIEGTDSRGIDNGYLVRGDLVRVQGVGSYPAPEGLTSRPPLVLTATLELPDGGEHTLFVLTNHFTSLSGGEGATEPRRTAQAAWNVTIIEEILGQNNPDASVIVMGDLNSFYNSLPLYTLASAGLRHVYEFVEEATLPYTYIFEGRTQTLDHILVSDSLFEQLVAVEALHINADYPIINWEDTTPQRVSDHDPLVAVFSLLDMP